MRDIIFILINNYLFILGYSDKAICLYDTI